MQERFRPLKRTLHKTSRRVSRTSARSGRSGYVLVVTMGLLVLAASLMVSVSRGTMRHTIAARLAVDEMQHRWGVISCRLAVLPYAESILLAAEVERHATSPSYRTHVRLGDEVFELTIADEQAKANVNVLLDHTDRATAEERLRQGLSGTGLGINVRLRPSASPLNGPSPVPTTSPTTKSIDAPVGLPVFIGGFGQIFEDASAEKLLAIQGSVRVTDLLTCWGGGRVNLRRVTPAGLQLAVGTKLSGVDQGRLLDMRNRVLQGTPLPLPKKGPVEKDPVLRMARAAGIDPKNFDGLISLTETSTCHSLWITANDRRRTWHFFSITDETEKNQPRNSAFVW